MPIVRRFVLFALFVFACAAQTDRDAAGKLMDSARVLAASKNPDDLRRADTTYEQAAELWRKVGDKQKQIEALYGAAWTHYSIGEFPRMLDLLNSAMEVAGTSDFPAARAELHSSLAVVHDARGEYRQAADEYAAAVEIHKSLNNATAVTQVTGFEASAWILLATAAEKAKETDTAIDAHRHAVALFQRIGDSKRAGQEFVRLGMVNQQIGTPSALDQAAVFYNNALPLFEAASDPADVAMTWWRLGTVADSQNQTERARDAFLKVMPYISDLPNGQSQGIALNSLAMVLDKLGDYAGAAGYYERAIPLFANARDETDQYLAGMKLGKIRENMSQTTEALALYQALLPVTHAAGKGADEATVYGRIGMIHFASREWQPALDAFNDAQQLHAGLKDKYGEASDWAIIGSVYGNRGQYREKLAANLRALALLEGGTNRQAEMQMLTETGDSYNSLHMSRQAIEYLEKARALAANDNAQMALVLVEMGEVYYGDSRLDKALELENQALDLVLKLDKPLFVNRVRNDIGMALQAKGEMTKAREIFEQGLADARNRKEVQQIYTCLNNLARLDQDLGDTQESVKLFEESLAMARQDSSGSETATLDGLGMSYHMLGQDDKALATLNQSLSLARKNGNDDHEAIALNNLAVVYDDMGRPQQALDAMEQALLKRRALQDEAGVADLLRALGGIYQNLGDYDRAESYFAQALDTQKQFDDEHGQALTHNSLGVIQMNRHEPAAALREFNQALPLVRKFDDRRGEATILSNMGNALLDAGELRDAAASFDSSLALVREMHYTDGEALALHGLGSVYERSGDLDKALESYRLALAIWRDLHAAAAEAKAHSLIAKVERKQGNIEGAITEVGESIRLLESQRGGLASEDLRAYFLASIGDPWKVQIDLLMDMHRAHPGQGWDRRAFEASERARARSLLDLLTQSRIDLDKGVDPALAARDRTAERSLSAKAAELQKIAPGSPDYTQLQNEIADLTAEQARVEAAIRAASPHNASLISPQPLGLGEIQKRVLDRQTTLLEYSLGEERSYLFVVTSTTLSADVLPKRSDIESAARDLNADLQDYQKDRTMFHKDAATLSAMILAPIASQLKGKRLVIVADGELTQVPFGVLPVDSGNQPLILTNEILAQPSASAVAVLREETARRKKPSGEIAVIADPVFESSDPRLRGATTPETAIPQVLSAAVRDTTRGSALTRLDHSAEEARAILALASRSRTLSLLGFQANKTDVLDGRLAGYRIVHFATHGLIDLTNPQLSGLALSLYDQKGQPVDGFLDLNTIFDMKLDADLVVLSACESGEGKLVAGEGPMGLTRGFFHAGAASLVVSLWSVDDEATSELMRRFYEGMLGSSRLRPAAALRAAQRSMFLNSRWQDPYYWAPFTIQGEWR